jgi:hypothetical protein
MNFTIFGQCAVIRQTGGELARKVHDAKPFHPQTEATLIFTSDPCCGCEYINSGSQRKLYLALKP